MIEIRNLSAGYGKKEVLHQVSLSVEEGRLTAVVGPNGCGKSTFLRALSGLLPHMSGAISVDGKALTAYKRKELAQRIAYLAQGRQTPDMTVGETVLHGRFPYLGYPERYTERDRSIAREAMAEMGLEPLANAHMEALSGGQRQNAYIAMALAQKTKYIFLDEPTTYLDIGHQLALMKTLRKLADGGRGIVAVMHDLPMALTFSDTVAVVQDGRIIAHGTPRALCETAVFEKVFGVPVSFDGNAYRYEL